MVKKHLMIILLMAYKCYGVRYKLTESEYAKMPQLFHLDDYSHCLLNPDGVYCTADIDIVSDDDSSELLTMMRNYSDDTKKHFNYSQVHYGICMTQTCKRFYAYNKTADLKLVLEGCLNQTLWENYELKCKISKPINCNYNETNIKKDTCDIVMAAFLILIITVNCVSSIYDVIFVRRKNYKVNRLLMCFSIPSNYSKLIASYKNFDSRVERLKSFHGLRTITMFGVVICHSFLPLSFAPENPHAVELQYGSIFHLLFLNGVLVVQTFFIMSGCLLAYKFELYAEKHEIRWTLIPKTIVKFWIKYTPSYVVVLGITTTWLRYAGSGPFWHILVTKEVEDCRINGWANLLYINNYIDSTMCMVQTWYLAANMQMLMIGCIICVLVRSNRSRNILLTLLFITGVVAPAAHTYYQDLDAIVLISPDFMRNDAKQSTFDNVYKRSHTNMVNFVLGLALGFLIYRLQGNKVDMDKIKKYQFLFLLTIPGIIGLLYTGTIFYIDDFQASIIERSIYAGLLKPLFGFIMILLIISCVFKIDDVYRVILEWNGWKIPSKLSYCVFLLHFMIIRVAGGIHTTLTPLNNLTSIEKSTVAIVVSFAAAFVLYLLVDAPLTEFLKTCLEYITNFNNETRTVKEVQNNTICRKKHYESTSVEKEAEINKKNDSTT